MNKPEPNDPAQGSADPKENAQPEGVQPPAAELGGPKPTPRDRKHMLRVEQERGTLDLDRSVVTAIVREETSHVDGLVQARRHGAWQAFKRLFSRSARQGIAMRVGDGCLSVDIVVTARYGVNIPALAEGLRRSVADKIEHMTGFKAETVNVVVDRIEPGPAPAEAPGQKPQA